MHRRLSWGARHFRRRPKLSSDPMSEFEEYSACPTCHHPLRGFGHFDPQPLSQLEVEAQHQFTQANNLYNPSTLEGYPMPPFGYEPAQEFEPDAAHSSYGENGERRDPDRYLKALYLSQAERHPDPLLTSTRLTTSMDKSRYGDASSEAASSSSRASYHPHETHRVRSDNSMRSLGHPHDHQFSMNQHQFASELSYPHEAQYKYPPQSHNFPARPMYHHGSYLDDSHFNHIHSSF
ncbi:hypothetical protein PSTG_03127 [Puccinia striiformis f. sp. tritici PST-78]|uniref:Uncharacterized protein n=1 Tax=Puccinia striiformis f. sp. tritici PST-78 TaxID=1165861 RepID=A0A0L0VWB5_9BASI|nr:hypothetical protein PSTG_03127 [Puccinia striiformis f. sp. tritici PST-78]